MPRTARLTYPGAFHHIYNRGLNKSPIFRQEADYLRLLDTLTDILNDGDWIIFAYCLMPNHYHFLIEEKKNPVAKLMGRLFTSYSQFFNKKYNRQGTLFQDRFKSKLIQKDQYFFEVSRYIHLNPVNAGLAVYPEEYEYSSLKEYLGTSTRKIINLDKVAILLGESKTRNEDYLKFVKAGIKLNLDDFDPFKSEEKIIGSAAFSTHKKIRSFS